MHVVTVPECECWGCEDTTLCLRFFGRSGHRRMDICLWCMTGALELLTGFGIVRSMKQWVRMRNASIELHGINKARFRERIPKRFRHQ